MGFDLVGTVAEMLRPLHQRVLDMIAPAIVRMIDDSSARQVLQVEMLKGEVRDDVERVQNYGFTSAPLAGAEAVAVCVGGERDHAVVIAVDDRRYRIVNLESGEVCVYNNTGSKVLLKANGDIEITPSSGVVTLAGDLNVSGTLTATTDVIGGGKSLKNHTHAGGSLGGTSTDSGSPFSVTTGSTGAPS